MILRGAREGALFADQRFQHGFGVGNGQPNSQRHQKRQIQQRPRPALRKKFPLRNQIKTGDGKRRRHEQWQINVKHLKPSLIEADDHGRQQQHRQHNHQRIADVRRQVIPGFNLGVKRRIATKHPRQNLYPRLHQPLGPACLLRLERRHLHRQFRRAFHILQVDELPSLELRPIRKIRIFGQRVVLPAARFLNRSPPPHSRRAIEIEKQPGARASRMFQHEMTVEQDRLHLREKRIIAVDVCPPCLHHASLGIGEVMNRAQQKIFWRREVRVENRDELSLRRFHPLRQRTGFVTLAVAAMVVADRITQRCIALHQPSRHFDGFVGGIVEQLDVEFLPRILQLADRLQQPLHHILLVEDRQLHRNSRQFLKPRRRLGSPLIAVLVVEIDQNVAVRPVTRQ